MNDEPRQLSSGQRRRILELMEDLPWGDVDGALKSVGDAILRLLEATAAYADQWDDREAQLPWMDEFSVAAADVLEMDTGTLLMYVGRLVRSLSLLYGLGTGDPKDVLTAEAYSPAGLLGRLNDLVLIDVSDEPPEPAQHR